MVEDRCGFVAVGEVCCQGGVHTDSAAVLVVADHDGEG